MHDYALVLWLHHEMEISQCQFWQRNFTILSKKPGYLIFRFDVRAAMDPTVVLGNIGADALELAAEKKDLDWIWQGLGYLMGSPKYWVAMPTVAPSMQMTELPL